MTTTSRIRIQLQTGSTNIKSVTNEGLGLTYLQVAMAVRTLHANTCDLFSKKTDQIKYEQAANTLCQTLERANNGRFEGRTAGNQFREEFWATRNGKTAMYRIDVEIKGSLATA
jgi:hypothetical protein